MSHYRFEDSIAWLKAQVLAVEIYKIFRESKDFGFRDQITRAAVSVSNNIAEGLERSGAQEARYFFGIAKGSCGEVRSMLYLAHKLTYISASDSTKLVDLTDEISRLLHVFGKKI